LRTAQYNQIVELGATCLPNGAWNFMGWGRNSEQVDLLLSGAGGSIVPMIRDELGYHVAALDSLRPDTQYVYRLAKPNSLLCACLQAGNRLQHINYDL